MAIFSNETLDLSRYPAPLAIRGIDYEGILTERKARLVALFAAAGIDFDVASLETDPAIIIEEADAYRELLAYARVNDAVKAVMIAFATGPDLDHLAAFYGVVRMVLVPASGLTPAVMEPDAELRRRTLLAPEAFATAGTSGAYMFHTLSANPNVKDANVWSPEPGRVNVAVQSRIGNGAPSEVLVDAVRAHLNRADIKPLTDIITVIPVTIVEYAIQVAGYSLPGPDSLLLKVEIEKSLQAMAETRRTPSRDVPLSAIYAASQLSAIDKIDVILPATDIAMGYGEVAVCTAINVTVQTYGG